MYCMAVGHSQHSHQECVEWVESHQTYQDQITSRILGLQFLHNDKKNSDKMTAAVCVDVVRWLLLLNPAHALHGGASYFAFVCVPVCPLTKYLNKYWTDQLEAFPWHREETIRFWNEKCPRVRVGVGAPKFGCNEKREERFVLSGYNP